MGTHILIIQGHPDFGASHLCHALAAAYAEGALAAGHTVETVEPARLSFPLLASASEWQEGTVPPGLLPAQQAFGRAGHIVLVYPLWLGDMPALLKGFLEQVLRPGFALTVSPRNPLKSGMLGGRSARVIVTMGMPAFVYRWFFRSHSVKSLKRNILNFVGIAPVATTIIGVTGMTPARVERWCTHMRRLGVQAK
ncbi:NAD(P)H-dependent oxidoreductase [Massilia niastensis]|uniref:NAD(P)H-dependent oxidoreductase n=1 Tax=Massilia niastensis TaxID=544911 RepID=UPI000369D10D|nr:NAD(P)H-dependent oxidoreductase [Massilia niastensis]